MTWHDLQLLASNGQKTITMKHLFPHQQHKRPMEKIRDRRHMEQQQLTMHQCTYSSKLFHSDKSLHDHASNQKLIQLLT